MWVTGGILQVDFVGLRWEPHVAIKWCVFLLQIPILPEEFTGSLDRFKLRTKGILRVRVIEARGLKKQDLLAKGDPYVVLETVPLHPVKTKVRWCHTVE